MNKLRVGGERDQNKRGRASILIQIYVYIEINRSAYRKKKVSKDKFFSLVMTKAHTYLNKYAVFNCWLA